MTHSLVSIGAIISKVYRDLRLTDPRFETDAIEWVGEAIKLIGRGVSFTRQEVTLTVENHRVALPVDLFRLQEVYVMEDAVSATDPNAYRNPLTHSSGSLIPSTIQAPGSTSGSDSYIVQGGYVHTSFEEGYVVLVYDGIALDPVDQTPLVPDEPNFQNSFLWFIMMKMTMGGWRHPNPEISFSKCEENWHRYCRQARTMALIPSIAEYENFLQAWVNMVPLERRREVDFGGSVSDVRYGIIYYPER